MTSFDIGCLMADLVDNDESLDEIILDVINDDRFRDAVRDAVIGCDGSKFVRLCEDVTYKMAKEMESE